jgi:hypothetical protein
LDLQSAHLWAPAAKKILVVTNSANDADLKAGVQWAVNNAGILRQKSPENFGTREFDIHPPINCTASPNFYEGRKKKILALLPNSPLPTFFTHVLII